MIDYNSSASASVNVARFVRKCFQNIAKSSWIPSSYRYKLVRLGGVRITNKAFIGEGVIFDSIKPEYIEIDEGATITARSVILSHFYKGTDYYYGHVKIGKKAFIGVGTIIANSVTIGDRAIVGAGSVVTKNIPSGEIWAGNPARFIRKRDDM